MTRGWGRTIALAFCTCVIIGAGYFYATEIREPDWRSAALEDIAFVRATLASDHPGAVPGEDPAFAAMLAEASDHAAGIAAEVNDAAGYFYALRGLTAPFQDAHLAVQFTRALPRPRRYPGLFVAEHASGTVTVAQSDADGAPPADATLLACDGKSPEALYRERVLPFAHLSWLDAKRPGDLPWILVDRGNPFAPLPSACDFLVDGVEQHFALDWMPLDADTLDAFAERVEPTVVQQTALSFRGEGLAWVSIASFFDSGEGVGEELAALMEAIAAERAAIEAADALVIDVRGNLGGASAAGYAVAAALWDEAHVEDRRPRHRITAWRASEDNLERIDDAMLPLRLRFGADSALYRTVSGIRDGLAAAVAAGDPFFEQLQDAPAPTGAAARPLPERIYFLTDTDCVSACLDFADLMLALDGVVHVGAPTSGDTRYLEVTAAPLPSGIGQLVYPTAVHRGRERGDNVILIPQRTFDGDLADDVALATWIATLE